MHTIFGLTFIQVLLKKSVNGVLNHYRSTNVPVIISYRLYIFVQKPRPADNLKKYKIKHIPKNRDILENSRYKSKQDEYMRL